MGYEVRHVLQLCLVGVPRESGIVVLPVGRHAARDGMDHLGICPAADPLRRGRDVRSNEDAEGGHETLATAQDRRLVGLCIRRYMAGHTPRGSKDDPAALRITLESLDFRSGSGSGAVSTQPPAAQR
jgi:hypothetical protein